MTRADTLARGLEWLTANRSHFAIVNAQSHPYYSIKPVAELAEAAQVLMRTEHAALGTALLDHAWSQLREGDLITQLLRDVNTLVQAAIYMPFYRNERRNPKLEEVIAERARTAELVPPLHRLPIAATLELLGIRAPWSLTQVIDAEWAARMGAPLHLTPTDLYMATHIAFYATDYGRKREGLGEVQTDYLRRWIPVWLDDLVAQGQLDLVAELAITASSIGAERVADKVWDALALHQRADGAIPYQVNDTRQVGVAGMTPERERFLRDYHSTLVGVMAAALGQ